MTNQSDLAAYGTINQQSMNSGFIKTSMSVKNYHIDYLTGHGASRLEPNMGRHRVSQQGLAAFAHKEHQPTMSTDYELKGLKSCRAALRHSQQVHFSEQTGTHYGMRVFLQRTVF